MTRFYAIDTHKAKRDMKDLEDTKDCKNKYDDMDAECLKDCEKAVKRLEKGEFDCLDRYFYLSLRLTYSVQSLKMRLRTRLKMKQKDPDHPVLLPSSSCV